MIFCAKAVTQVHVELWTSGDHKNFAHAELPADMKKLPPKDTIWGHRDVNFEAARIVSTGIQDVT